MLFFTLLSSSGTKPLPKYTRLQTSLKQSKIIEHVIRLTLSDPTRHSSALGVGASLVCNPCEDPSNGKHSAWQTLEGSVRSLGRKDAYRPPPSPAHHSLPSLRHELQPSVDTLVYQPCHAHPSVPLFLALSLRTCGAPAPPLGVSLPDVPGLGLVLLSTPRALVFISL